ncbi:protein of unknown function [Magnetospirillum sp. XM-1]|nr:protein of unknown function [Magnetospirillum sp. XM-1]
MPVRHRRRTARGDLRRPCGRTPPHPGGGHACARSLLRPHHERQRLARRAQHLCGPQSPVAGRGGAFPQDGRRHPGGHHPAQADRADPEGQRGTVQDAAQRHHRRCPGAHSRGAHPGRQRVPGRPLRPHARRHGGNQLLRLAAARPGRSPPRPAQPSAGGEGAASHPRRTGRRHLRQPRLSHRRCGRNHRPDRRVLPRRHLAAQCPEDGGEGPGRPGALQRRTGAVRLCGLPRPARAAPGHHRASATARAPVEGQAERRHRRIPAFRRGWRPAHGHPDPRPAGLFTHRPRRPRDGGPGTGRGHRRRPGQPVGHHRGKPRLGELRHRHAHRPRQPHGTDPPVPEPDRQRAEIPLRRPRAGGDPERHTLGKRLGHRHPRQRHRHRAGIFRTHLHDLPAPARTRAVRRHRHRPGGVPQDRRAPRRLDPGGLHRRRRQHLHHLAARHRDVAPSLPPPCVMAGLDPAIRAVRTAKKAAPAGAAFL